MAVFNPQVQPTQPQDFSGQFHAIAGPTPDKSSEILLGTIGGAVTDLTGLADRTVKQSIDHEVYAQVDQQRDAYTQALEAARTQVRGPMASSSSPTQAMSFAEEEQSESLPPQISGLSNTLQGLSSARSAGKINDTYYTQQLNSIAKSLRSQYPGYRDYIDSKISSVSGVDPANAYYKNLMQDISQGMALKGTADKDINTLLMDANKKGFEGADTMLIAHRANVAAGIDDSNQVLRWYNSWTSKKANHEAMKNAREEATWNKDDTNLKYKQDFSQIADDYVTQGINTFRVGTGSMTVQGFMDKVTQSSVRGEDVDPKVLDQGVTAIGALKAEATRQLYSNARKVQSNGLSFETVLGSDATKKMIEDKVAIYDTMIQQIRNKDTGSAFSAARQVEGIGSFSQKQLLTSPTIGAVAQKMKAVNDTFPQMAPILTQMVIGSGLTGDLQTYLQDKTTSAVTTPGSSLIDDFRGAKKLTQGSEGSSSSQKLYKEVLRIPTIIGSQDPRVPDEAKLAAAKYAFAPKNTRVLDEINMDSMVNGKYVPGKYSAYSILTAPQVTNNMWKLRQRGGEGQEVWGEYKNWSEVSFAKLFRSDIQTLEGFVGKDVKSIGWDEQNGRFREIQASDPGAPKRFISGPGSGLVTQPKAIVDQEALNRINTVVRRINGGLSSLKEVIGKEGGDTSEYLARTLITIGMDTEGKVQGLPKNILDNIAAAKLKQGMFKPEDNFFQKAK